MNPFSTYIYADKNIQLISYGKNVAEISQAITHQKSNAYQRQATAKSVDACHHMRTLKFLSEYIRNDLNTLYYHMHNIASKIH